MPTWCFETEQIWVGGLTLEGIKFISPLSQTAMNFNNRTWKVALIQKKQVELINCILGTR